METKDIMACIIGALRRWDRGCCIKPNGSVSKRASSFRGGTIIYTVALYITVSLLGAPLDTTAEQTKDAAVVGVATTLGSGSSSIQAHPESPVLVYSEDANKINSSLWANSGDPKEIAAPGNTAQTHTSESSSTKVAVGETVPYWLESGLYNGDPKGVFLAFSKVVTSAGVPWIRLHFEDVRLGPEDYIEVQSAEFGSSQRLHQADVSQRRLASAYFNGSAVTVSLWVGPSGRQSGFIISSIEIGFLLSDEVQAERIIGGIDTRVLSDDERVCLLSFRQQVCSVPNVNDDVVCGCPGGACNAATGRCNGGTRNGLACGNAICNATSAGSTCSNDLITFVGTSFFIERATATGGHCALTSGHNFFGRNEFWPQTGSVHPMLHCRVYGCGPAPAQCGNVVNGAGTCIGGTRNGQFCVPPVMNGAPMATPNEQYLVTLADGESRNNPHDWALFSSRVDKPFFELNQAAGANVLVRVTGHGRDTDTPANTFFQQTDTATGATRIGDVIRHFVDTEGGNSGSPIIFDGKAWGIHNGFEPLVAGNPNRGVHVSHTHPAGAPGRPLAPAIAANCTIEPCFGRLTTFGCNVNGVVGACVGTNGNDNIIGTVGNDVIVGLSGNDQIRSDRGNDLVCGGSGNDRIDGSEGDDSIDGGPGKDDKCEGGRHITGDVCTNCERLSGCNP